MDVLDPERERRAVVVVAHGLNVRATAMRELYEPLRRRGATIVLIRLRGHAHDAAATATERDEWLHVSSSDWIDDWRDGARTGAELAGGVPLVFLGFSLGTLVHLAGMSRGLAEGPAFDRQVLIAPPICVHPTTRLPLVLRPFGPRFLVRSFTPRAIRSQDATSMAAYHAIFELQREVEHATAPARLKLPTVVLMDPRDELVSYRGLLRWIERNGLHDVWEVRAIRKDRSSARSVLHHDAIDARGLGATAIASVNRMIGDVVFGVTADEPAS